MYTNVYIHTQMYTFIHINVCTQMYTFIHINIHKYIHSYINICTCMFISATFLLTDDLTETDSSPKQLTIDMKQKSDIVIKDYVINFEKVPLVTPTGDVLLKEMTFEVISGRNVLVCGPNGCGKSSLFRVLGQVKNLIIVYNEMIGLSYVCPHANSTSACTHPFKCKHTHTDMHTPMNTHASLIECAQSNYVDYTHTHAYTEHMPRTHHLPRLVTHDTLQTCVKIYSSAHAHLQTPKQLHVYIYIHMSVYIPHIRTHECIHTTHRIFLN